jgi:hypothetical protein
MQGFDVDVMGLVSPLILPMVFNGTLADTHVGKPVKLTANGTVSLCADTDPFFGLIVTVEKASNVAGVQIAGSFDKVAYSGTDLTVGDNIVVSDADGKLKGAVSGTTITVLSVDTTAKTVSFIKGY